MFPMSIIVAFGIFASAFAAPYPSSVQTTIQGINNNITNLINDIVRSNTGAINYDYASVQSQLVSLFNSLGFTGCGQGTPQPPATSDSAIQYLQQVQLGLNVAAQDIINSSPALQVDLCSALGYYSAVSCFAGVSNPIIGVIGGCPTTTTNTSSTTTIAYTPFLCNPAHSYPTAVTCVVVSGTYQLSTLSPTPTSTSLIIACNPAHSYPSPATCISTNGSLTLVTPTSTPTTTTTTRFACNPAHSYPSPVTCVSTNGSLALVTPTLTSTVTLVAKI